jgi:amino acid adenylation domain-containing protein
MDKEADRPFDLERGPVLRAHLFVRSTNEHFLLITAHHIAVDAMSIDVLTHDLRKFYNREPLRPLSFHYSDYVRWQVEMLASPRGDQLWQHWQKQLSGELPVLNLPTDRRRPAVQTYRGATHSFVLNEDLTRSLKEVAKDNHATLYMTLLAVFQVLLYRYTGQEDISVGSPMASRSQGDFTGIVGYFVNPVVMRVNLSGNPTFKAFLTHVRQTVLAVFELADYPFPLLVERLHPDRDPSRSPLFQSAFAWINYRQKSGIEEVPSFKSNQTTPQIDSPKLELELIGGGQRGSEFDLVISIFEEEKSLAVQWRYNTDLFEATTIVRMAGHFETLLKCIVANPEQRISVIPMMTTTERHQLLVEWNDSKRDYRKESCIHELIEAQAELTPDAVAIIFEERQLTYGELNTRANQLARHLRKLGVVPDMLIGVYLERSIEMVVALLGILKAGGAYVPLDPTYPIERLSVMVEDAQLSIIVTQPELIEKLPAHEAQLIALTPYWSQFCGESEENPTPNTDASNLAYVIYTSGSTGKPKGVQIPRSALSNFLHSMSERPGITSQDTLLAVTTLSFDIAGLEIHLPLSLGARVVLIRHESAADASQLAEKIKNSGATLMQATPATWRLLLESGWQGNKQLKILCGGEALPRELANQLIEKSASLWNMYGPTETTIWSTVHQVSSTEGPVLVGRPIANTRIYIIDRYMQPTPIGVPGELCIGGTGVARGYLNRSELTEEKFIADPFSQEPGARIYRTGDRARYLADGNIELLGRIDHQVKVRGFRIELGEIEAVLREHPALRDAVVLAREDVPGDKRLVGYVVAADTPPTTGELRSFLQQKLPDYMVPGVFVFLEALPLTPNGKVDRRALPVPDMARPELESVFVAPESGVEKTLAEIWRAVLGLERVGIHDNFFDLGGHSLLLAKVHSQFQAAFGREVAMIDLFRYPTISALAKYLNNAPEEDSLKESANRAERRRSAMQQQQLRMQSIAERRTALRRG